MFLQCATNVDVAARMQLKINSDVMKVVMKAMALFGSNLKFITSKTWMDQTEVSQWDDLQHRYGDQWDEQVRVAMNHYLFCAQEALADGGLGGSVKWRLNFVDSTAILELEFV